jgi:hypothetical protein
VNIHDRPDTDVLQHLDQTTEYIRNVLSESPDNKVLVRRISVNLQLITLNYHRCIVFKALVAVQPSSAPISSPRRTAK